VCQQARAFFRENGIGFEERDIEANPRYRAELVRATGKASVPLIEVDGTKISGFGQASVTNALRESVERRLGVRGLAIESR
jgi:glutaredoxin